MPDSRCPIADYLAEVAAIDPKSSDCQRRVGECQDKYFPGVIDHDYEPALRLNFAQTDTREKLWFYISCWLRIHQHRRSIVEQVAKARELPGVPSPEGGRYDRINIQISERDMEIDANQCLHEVYGRLVEFGFGPIVRRIQKEGEYQEEVVLRIGSETMVSKDTVKKGDFSLTSTKLMTSDKPFCP